MITHICNLCSSFKVRDTHHIHTKKLAKLLFCTRTIKSKKNTKCSNSRTRYIFVHTSINTWVRWSFISKQSIQWKEFTSGKFPLHHRVQTGSGIHRSCYPMGGGWV